MKRRDFIKLISAAGAVSFSGGCIAGSAKKSLSKGKPNLLVIHTDEHNFRTLGCYRKLLPPEQALMWGSAVVKTPHIDRLANEGAICTSFYATSPVCTPSRASFVSGRYPQNTPAAGNNIPMDNDVVTFAEILGRNGYATGYAGKWHLDGEAKPGWAPKRNFGFEDNRYMFNRGHWKLLDITNGKPMVGIIEGKPFPPLIGDKKTFTTDWLCDRGIEYMDAHKNEPFCYMISIPDPHGPDSVRAPYDTMFEHQEYSQPRSAKKSEDGLPSWGQKENLQYDQSKYYGMVKCIDDNVGKILKYLEESSLLDNTIVVFTSDHGDLRGEHGRHNKGVPYEGSARIPFIIRWPGKIKVSTVVRQSLGCVDFLPTILAMMDVPTAGKEQGRDASKLFTEDKAGADWDDITFMRASGTSDVAWIAAVSSRYKLIYCAKDDPWFFDLEKDPDELVNNFQNPKYRDVIRKMARGLIEYGNKYDDPRIKKDMVAADLAWSTGPEDKYISTREPFVKPDKPKKKKRKNKKEKMKRYFLLVVALLLTLQVCAVAKIVMPVTFGDGMVLQREMPIRIFGQASEGAPVTVRFNGQQEKAIASNGEWMVILKAMEAGGPHELQVSGDGEEIVFKDVMLGEVWLAGGQSNMQMHLGGTADFQKHLPEKEKPELRFIQIPVTEFGEINRDGVKWKYFDKTSVPGFSAVAYFFATELQKRLGVTVGVIGSYRGATWNENWMTPESIKQEPELKYLFEKYDKEYGEFKDEAAYEKAYQKYLTDMSEWRAKGGWSSGMVPYAPLGPKAYQRPSGLYNCMIKPLQPYTIRGCIWYQGEGNAGRFEEFRVLFPAFIEGWRKTWERPQMPFYFVQLPGFKGTTWPQFRQSQLYCSQVIDNCGMVVSEGCGDENEIHPRTKKPIGDRLAIAASAEVYGQDHIPYGPVIKSVEFQEGKAKISFEYSGGGLVLRSDETDSFEIAGDDEVFTKAQAAVDGSELLLWSDEIKQPKYVRYAYSPNPKMPLFNQEGLPASPFTTEQTWAP